MRELKHSLLVTNCANCTFYIINNDLQKSFSHIEKNTSSGLTLQKFAMEGGKWIDGISELDREIGVPSFKNPTEIRTGLKK